MKLVMVFDFLILLDFMGVDRCVRWGWWENFFFWVKDFGSGGLCFSSDLFVV